MSNNDARKLARKKRVGATLSAAGGVAGVTGLGLMAAKKPKAALWASTIGGGIGGTNALLQGPIQRAEAKALDPRRYLRRSSVEKGLLDRRRERQQRRAAMREKLMNAPHSDVDDFTRKIPVGKSMPTGLSVPRGLRQRKTYTASSVRALPATGRLVRTKPGVR